MFQKHLQESVRKQLDVEGSLDGYDSAKLRTSANQITVSLEEVRTLRDDPDSSRMFCSARVLVKIPSETLETTDATRSLAQIGSVAKLANQNGIERYASSYGVELEYSTQPTDDGTKVVAETTGQNPLFPFLTEIYASYMLSDAVKNRVAEADKAANDEEQQQKVADAEVEAAQKESASADANEAKIENTIAVQRIAAIWQAIPKETRARLLELQRAWIRKKTAACRVEAAGTSTLAAAREANQLRCETRLTNERSRQLEPLASYNSDGDSAGNAADVEPM